MNESKTVLIVGAGSDLAAEFALQCARDGYSIYLMGRNVETLRLLEDRLGKESVAFVTSIPFDILHLAEFEDVLSGMEPFPTLCLVAVGDLGSDVQGAEQITHMMRVNGEGPSIVSELYIQALLERKLWGCLVGVTSVAGVRGRASNYPYGAAKAAYITFLSGLRSRYAADGVHVMTVIPGFVDTKMLRGHYAPPWLTSNVTDLVRAIRRSIRNQKSIVYSGFVWLLISVVIRVLPEPIFKRFKL